MNAWGAHMVPTSDAGDVGDGNAVHLTKSFTDSYKFAISNDEITLKIASMIH